MNFNEHSELKGVHAILSPSSYHWIRYRDREKFENLVRSKEAVKRGIEDHEFACLCIKRKQRLPKSNATLNMYVNDAIGFRMEPEQVLMYSDQCFGTADAIRFDERKKKLRIHDLKTGSIPASMDQLMIYAAIFCLEYKAKPSDIKVELRIYQNNDVVIYEPDSKELTKVIDQVIFANKTVNEILDM